MIHEVIDMGDTVAREVMVPRVDLTTMEDTSTLSGRLRSCVRPAILIPIYRQR